MKTERESSSTWYEGMKKMGSSKEGISNDERKEVARSGRKKKKKKRKVMF